MASIEARINKLEEKAKQRNKTADCKTVFCLDGETVEDACRRLEMPIAEIEDSNIFFVRFVSANDKI